MKKSPAIWSELALARLDLANYLATLKPADWDKQSLAAAWKVRDVVAHLILESSYTLPAMTVGIVKAKGNPNIFMRVTAQQLGRKSPTTLIQMLRDSAHSHKTPIGITAAEALVDCYIHTLDIKLPLGEQTVLTSQQSLFILKMSYKSYRLLGAWIVGIHKRAQGLHLVASDVAWTRGRGAMVTGSAQDLILAISGRPVGLQNLSGAGVAILRRQLSA